MTSGIGVFLLGVNSLPNFGFTVSGTVTDNQTGSPIVGASVTLTGHSAVLTNGSGFYSFTGVTVGLKNISATFAGYNAFGPQAVNVTGNQTENFAMSALSSVSPPGAGTAPFSPGRVDFATGFPFSYPYLAIKCTALAAGNITALNYVEGELSLSTWEIRDYPSDVLLASGGWNTANPASWRVQTTGSGLPLAVTLGQQFTVAVSTASFHGSSSIPYSYTQNNIQQDDVRRGNTIATPSTWTSIFTTPGMGAPVGSQAPTLGVTLVTP
jgi:hypothetical protein